MAVFRFVPVGPVHADKQLWRAHDKLFATVIVKAAFDANGGLLDDCDPIVVTDRYRDDDPTRSLLESSDLAPYLGTGEVLFSGAAYVPGGGRAQARIRVQDGQRSVVEKCLIVRAPPGSTGVVRIPVSYENALGGAGHAANPVGIAQPSLVHGTSSSEPASLGPIAPFWRARTSLLGEGHKRPRPGDILELETGFPWEYFHAAPPDQRSASFFNGEERIFLEHLSPNSTEVVLRLPGARAQARVLRSEAHDNLALGFNADVLRVDGERLRSTVTWRGFFELSSEEEELVLAVGLELAGEPVAWPVQAQGRTVELLAPETDHTEGGAPLLRPSSGTGPLVSIPVTPATLPFSEPPAKRGSSDRVLAAVPGAPWGTPVVPVAVPLGLGTVVAESSMPPAATPAPPPAAPAPPPAVRPAPAAPVPPPLRANMPGVMAAPLPAPAPSPGSEVDSIVRLSPGLGSHLLLAVMDQRAKKGSS